MIVYRVHKRLSPGIVVLRSTQYDAAMWTLRKLRSRPRKCESCGDVIARGAEAWGPITNRYNRMHRVCLRCVPVVDEPAKSR